MSVPSARWTNSTAFLRESLFAVLMFVWVPLSLISISVSKSSWSLHLCIMIIHKSDSLLNSWLLYDFPTNLLVYNKFFFIYVWYKMELLPLFYDGSLTKKFWFALRKKYCQEFGILHPISTIFTDERHFQSWEISNEQFLLNSRSMPFTS